MPLLITLSEQLPNDEDGEPLSNADVLALYRLNWRNIDTFADISEDALEEVRDRTLVRYLTDNFGIVREVMRAATATDGGVTPRVTTVGGLVADPRRRRQSELFGLIEDDGDYGDARDALCNAMHSEDALGAENAAEYAKETFEDIRGQVDEVTDDDDDVDRLQTVLTEHLNACIVTAEKTVDAAAATREGRDVAAHRAYAEAQEWFSEAADRARELNNHLRL